MKNEAEIIKTLAPYLLAFPSCKANEGTLVIYARALSAYNVGEINAAMFKLVKSCKFFPTIAEIGEQVENLRQFVREEHGGQPSIPSADEAWAEVQRLAKTCHVYKPWTFSHPAVEMAVNHFGKYELCTLEIYAVNTARAQFMRIYDAIVKRMKDKQLNQETIAALPRRDVDGLLGDLARNPPALPGGKKEVGA